MNQKSKILLVAFVAIAVFFLGGTLLPPVLDLVNQYREEQALLQRMATDPIYELVDAVESANPNLTVLTVLETDTKGQSRVVVWVLHGNVEPVEDDSDVYVAEMLRLLMQSLLDYKPTKHIYTVVFGAYRETMTVEGSKAQVLALAAYSLSADSIRTFLQNPVPETLLLLERQRTFTFEYLGYYQIVCPEILPRESGYTYPWEKMQDADDCASCN